MIGQPDLRGHVEQNATFDVRWHTIPEPARAHTPGLAEPDELGVFTQAKQLGATTFARLEGCWSGNERIYFDATSGGGARAPGQIWEYQPQSQKLTMLFESPGKNVLNMPDNLCVNPHGGLALCEDGDYGKNKLAQRIHLLSQDGQLIPLALNDAELHGERNGIEGDFRSTEWAGATFSPDGQWLFANLQGPGITLAITGPWKELMA